MTIDLYGIPNCDTVKKARAWLNAAGIEYSFHDYKKSPPDAALLNGWAEAVGWEKLLNRAGTTFRKLPEDQRSVASRDDAVALMVAHPSAIKRPVVVHPGGLLVGFSPENWDQALR
jgi:arsenate reductase (glutaredoxin)